MMGQNKSIVLRDGVTLHSDIREKGCPVWLVATHGVSEHLGRHSYLPELFGHDFNICQYDLRGHGRSAGPRTYVENFSDYAQDLREVLEFLKETYKMERFALYGHSMGGLITADYLQNYATEELYPERVLLSAPPVGFSGFLGSLINNVPREMVGLMARLPYGVQLGDMVDTNYLSHDPHVKQNFKQDPLNSPKIHTKLLLELVKASKEVFSRPIRPKCPSFCVYGGNDQIVSRDYLRYYFENIDKSFSLKEFEGAYHEIHHEIEKYRKPYFEYLKGIFDDMLYSE